MNSQLSRGIYVTVGAALGAAAVGALVGRAFVGRRKHSRDSALVDQFDQPDLPRSVREAVTASARTHRSSHPVPNDVAREIADRAEGRRAISGDRRQEVSSLVAPHALAPERDSIGEELVDPGASEVPLGQSAAALQREQTGTGVHDEVSPAFDDEDTRTDLTASSARALQRDVDDAYDAIAPDDLGSEWLARATEASPIDETGDDPERRPPELLFESGMSVVSEGSLKAADAEQIESDASAHLEGDANTTPERAANTASNRAAGARWNDDDYVREDIDELREKETQ